MDNVNLHPVDPSGEKMVEKLQETQQGLGRGPGEQNHPLELMLAPVPAQTGNCDDLYWAGSEEWGFSEDEDRMHPSARGGNGPLGMK